MDLVEGFVQAYEEMRERYSRLAELCAGQCESGFEHSGLRGIVTWRAKRVDRLRDKLQKRALRKAYQTEKDILTDVYDLAGVRIALYFPGDKEDVDAFLADQFIIEERKDFPHSEEGARYARRFSGYTARHYRVRLREETLLEQTSLLSPLRVEIQVGSVLMHAWAEVEHDLAYKPKTGTLSADEYAILDELNGLVHAGEIALERLQVAVKRRITEELAVFSSHYELSAFLHDRVKRQRRSEKDPLIGRADVFYRFLQLANMDQVSLLAPYLTQLDPNQESRPVVPQLVDLIFAEKESLYHVYNRARMEVSERDPYRRPDELISYFSCERALGSFMRCWIALDTLLREHRSERQSYSEVLEALLSPKLFSKGVIEDRVLRLEEIRQIRNQVIFGVKFPSENELMEAERFLQGILQEIRNPINIIP